MSGRLIGIDWGTTSFRAYLLDGRGRIVDRSSTPRGILQLGDLSFDDCFEQEAGGWLKSEPDLPVIVSGMVGSRQGWVEVPYQPCPADPRSLAAKLHLHTARGGKRIRFVPGLRTEGELPDVMRGEETELVGALREHPGPEMFVLPGTHSKWAWVRSGRFDGFATFMTGEIFAVLKAHSILGRLMRTAPFDADAFDKGAALGLDPGRMAAGLLHRLFSARTLPLLGKLPDTAVESYLSGLLIGAEVREALASHGLGNGASIVLVGGTDLVARYDRVLEQAGVNATRAAPDAAARGHFVLAQQAGLLE